MKREERREKERRKRKRNRREKREREENVRRRKEEREREKSVSCQCGKLCRIQRQRRRGDRKCRTASIVEKIIQCCGRMDQAGGLDASRESQHTRIYWSDSENHETIRREHADRNHLSFRGIQKKTKAERQECQPKKPSSTS